MSRVRQKRSEGNGDRGIHTGMAEGLFWPALRPRWQVTGGR